MVTVNEIQIFFHKYTFAFTWSTKQKTISHIAKISCKQSHLIFNFFFRSLHAGHSVALVVPRLWLKMKPTLRNGTNASTSLLKSMAICRFSTHSFVSTLFFSRQKFHGTNRSASDLSKQDRELQSSKRFGSKFLTAF